MNIRLVAVDADGKEIDHDDDRHPDVAPVNSLRQDVVPRIGDEMLFYNTHGRNFTWTVVNVTWMVCPGAWVNGDGLAHVCVMIQRKDG